ncbi:peptidase M16 inactive domain-containing protein [Toxoplasma gondii RUB]|uniref:Peptidase M16 inactive domain-containing protein n=1 Tax=Toxoplasma gondii RUB TaxID=935652 RepID=A0A086LTS1_TOXGO|nr:peptidase M16 inactive domain-containing protein [Toxoplasma gondii RUB]
MALFRFLVLRRGLRGIVLMFTRFESRTRFSRRSWMQTRRRPPPHPGPPASFSLTVDASPSVPDFSSSLSSPSSLFLSSRSPLQASLSVPPPSLADGVLSPSAEASGFISSFSSRSALGSSASSPLLPAHPYAAKNELPNGLAYFLLPHAYPPGSLEVHMEVHAGSTSEGEHERGIAHLCEHISYMGSRKREALIRHQAETNAYTDFHHTVFFAAWRGGDKEDETTRDASQEQLTTEAKLRLALAAMREVLEAPTQFTTERLNRERAAVISEASLVNTISYRKEQILLSLLHAETILPSRFPIGRLDQIRSWRVEDARRFHARCYRPDNAAIYVVGDIGRERAEKVVREILGPVKPKEEEESNWLKLKDVWKNTVKHVSAWFPPLAHRWRSSSSSTSLPSSPASSSRPSASPESPSADAPPSAASPETSQASSASARGSASGGCPSSSLFSSRELHIWKHPLIQQFSLVFLSKKPLQPLKTFADYKRLILRKLILQALSLRLSCATRERGANIHQIDLCEVNSIKEGCRVLSLEVQSNQRGEEWKDAINTAIQQVRQMAHYGLSRSELRSLLSTYSVNLRRLRLSQLSSADMLRVVMETAACHHTLLHLEEEKQIAMDLLGLHCATTNSPIVPSESTESSSAPGSVSPSSSPEASLSAPAGPLALASARDTDEEHSALEASEDAEAERADADALAASEEELLREINKEANDLCRWIEIHPDDAQSGPDVVLAFMHGPAASERPRKKSAEQGNEDGAAESLEGNEVTEDRVPSPAVPSCSALVSRRLRPGPLDGTEREVKRHRPPGSGDESSADQGADAKKENPPDPVEQNGGDATHGDTTIVPIKKEDIAAAITHAFQQEIGPPTADIQAPARLLSAEESAALFRQATEFRDVVHEGNRESRKVTRPEISPENAGISGDHATPLLHRIGPEKKDDNADSEWAFLRSHSMRLTRLHNNIKFNAKVADDEKGTAHIRLLLPGGRMGAAVNPTALSSPSPQGRRLEQEGAKEANDVDGVNGHRGVPTVLNVNPDSAESRMRSQLETRSRWGAALVLGARTMMEGGALGEFTRQQVERFCQRNLLGVSIDCLDEFFSIDISVPTNIGSDFPVHNGPAGGPLESAFQLLRLVLSSFVYEEDAFDRARQQVLLDCEHYTKDLSAYSLGELVIEMSGGDPRFLCLRPEVVKTLSFADVKRVVRTLLQDQLKAGNMELSVVGDINVRDTEVLAQAYLGTLQNIPLNEDDSTAEQVAEGESDVAGRLHVSGGQCDEQKSNDMDACLAESPFLHLQRRRSSVISRPLEETNGREEASGRARDQKRKEQRVYVHVIDSDERAVVHLAGYASNRWGVLPNGRLAWTSSHPFASSFAPSSFSFSNARTHHAGSQSELGGETARNVDQEEGKGKPLGADSEDEALWDPRRHPAFGRVALWLLQEIVSKRMFSVLREEQRLTYDATFDFLSFEILRGGLFVVTVHTEPRLVEAVLQVARTALRDLATVRPLQGYQLESAKKQIISRHAHDRQMGRYWMELLAGLQLDNLPQKNIAYIRDLPAVVESVTLEDLQEIFESFGLRDADLWEGVGTAGPVPPGGFIGRKSGDRKRLSVASTLRG